MRTSYLRAVALPVTAIAMIGLASPAVARTWISVGSGYWIDRDSIRRQGDLVYFNLNWNDPARGAPESNDSGSDKVYNCATNHVYSAEAGPSDAGGGVLTGASAAEYSNILCR